MMIRATQTLEEAEDQLRRFETVAHRASPEARAMVRFILAERIVDLGGTPPSLLGMYPPRRTPMGMRTRVVAARNSPPETPAYSPAPCV